MAEDFDEETPEEAAALDRAAELAAADASQAVEPFDATAMANRKGRKLKESIDASLKQTIIDGLRPIADGLISVVVTDKYLVGNFGDWADSEAVDTFKAVAESVGLVPETENEAGDLLAMDKYKGGHEIELDVPPTLTQESFKNWTGYP